MEKIRVAVRVRPQESEDEFNWRVDNNQISLHGAPIPGISFDFDHLLDKHIDNDTVYNILVKNIIHSAVEGFNGTIFTYGQTGTGTMKGIIHRAVKDVFRKIQQMSVKYEFRILVSCLQIYNEEIIDLLAEDNHQKFETDESLLRGPYVKGLREEIVNSIDQVLGLFQEASRRSVDLAHTIFEMVIESNPKDTFSLSGSTSNADGRISVLNLVDLAGSERAAETQTEEEGEHMDKSLMVLCDVINKLSEDGEQRGHIPYCDSKLTHLLRPALGGNAKTSIICTISLEQIGRSERNLEKFFNKYEVHSPCILISLNISCFRHIVLQFSNVKESQENANQIEEDDDESNEESDEERDEESDEERDEEHESYGEDYGDVDASDAEDEAEDYHPDEIYFEKDHESIPWQHYVNNVLLTPVEGLYLKAGAILREDDLTSSPAFPAVNSEEIANLFMAFESGVHQDLQLGGKTYSMIRVEPDTMHGEKGGECVTIMKTLQTLVVGVYEEPMIRAQCDALVRATADTIRNQGC